MRKENIDALDEIHKGACMGMDAINYVLEKVEDSNFKKVLEIEYKKYQKVEKEIDKLYPKYNDDKPHETNAFTKLMTWYGINIKTFNDKSNSKIAELLMQGTNMGIIEGRKVLNNKEINEDVRNIIDKYVNMQEDSIKILKTYL